MGPDWTSAGALALEGIGTTLSGILTALLIGLLITIAVILAYGRLGVFRRPVHPFYHFLAKLWIPYLVVVGLFFSFKLGLLRAVHSLAATVNEKTVNAIYDNAVSPFIGSAEEKGVLLATLQRTASTPHHLNAALDSLLTTALHDQPDSALSPTRRFTNMITDKVIAHYGDDLTQAVLYGLYLKTNDDILGREGKGVDYSGFRSGIEQLRTVDVAAVERTIRSNLSNLTLYVIDVQYAHMRNGILLVALVSMLLPLLEWGIYRLVMRSPSVEAQEPQQEGPLRPS